MDFISGLSIANSAAFFLFAVAPLLAFAYRMRAPKKRQVISSLLFIRQLTPKRTVQSRIKLPWRFFLELLALLLLAAAALSPTWDSSAPRVAVLIDNSLSMRAADGNTGQTRFAAAYLEADSWIRQQPSDSLFTLFVATPKLTAISPQPRSASEVRSELGELKSGTDPDNIGGVLDELVQSGNFDKIFVVSDKKAERLEGASGHSSVEAKQVGQPAANLAIAQFREETRELTESRRTLVTSVALSGPRDIPVRVELAVAKNGGRENLGEPLASTVVTAAKDRLVDVVFPLPIGKNETTELRVSVKPEGTAKTFQDALSEDNDASLKLGTRPDSAILLVSPPTNGGATLGLETLPGMRVETATPESFSRLSSEDGSRYKLTVFHEVAPTQPWHHPALYIVPPRGNALFPVRSEERMPRISSWNENHTLLSYLNIAALKPSAAVVFDPPSWAQSVLNVESGPVIVAGEFEGVRALGVGFELLPFEGRKTPASTVLFLNAMSWLTGGTELGSSLRHYLPEESGTFREQSFTIPVEAQRHARSGTDVTPLWPIFLTIALVLLFADLIWSVIRKPQTSERYAEA